MVDGRAREAWGRTSSLMAFIGYVHGDPKKTGRRTLADFVPPAYAPTGRSEGAIPIENLGELREIFISPGMKPRG